MIESELYIFDLDDTLFLESEYVLSGLKEVSLFFDRKYSLGGTKSFTYLENQFLKFGRDEIFNKLYHHYTIAFNEDDIKELVGVYRNHKPNIKLSGSITNVLIGLRDGGRKIAIVTDGLPLMQKNKVEALGIEALVDIVVYCWEIKHPKPDPQGFKLAYENLGINKEKCVIIGDHPVNDIQPAFQLGIQSCRILNGRYKNKLDQVEYPSQFQYNTVEEMFKEQYGY